MRELWIVSNNTSGRNYEIEENEVQNIIDLAYKCGRGESGEIAQLYENDEEISRCYWDCQYRKYRKY